MTHLSSGVNTSITLHRRSLEALLAGPRQPSIRCFLSIRPIKPRIAIILIILPGKVKYGGHIPLSLCNLISHSQCLCTSSTITVVSPVCSCNTCIYNSMDHVISCFLTDHNQATKLGFHLSSMLPINRSIIWYWTNSLSL